MTRIIGADYVLSREQVRSLSHPLHIWRSISQDLRAKAIDAGATNPGPLRMRRYSEGVILSREQHMEDPS